ncbi:MAG: SDR family NAD(P)-dependent oxidoreductase, partial [Gammaproteobacteria bacterium]
MQDFSDQVVMITGAAGVLGRAVVSHFETRGACVCAVDVDAATLDQSFPGRSDDATHLYLACDLRDREACAAGAAQIIDQFGRIDVLANIAGGFLMGEPVHGTSDETWNYLFDLNTRSILNCVAAVVPQMLRQKGGKIVNIAARAGLRGVANMGAYSASKSVVIRLTESMAEELKARDINVNCILPSIIDTPRNRADMPKADFSKWVPAGEIAKVVGFLASEDARMIHGAAVPVE